MRVTTDIGIIGAGPAGCAVAILLARRGYQVALVERAATPPSKLCGDYLTAGAVDILTNALGVLPCLLAAGAVGVACQTVTTHSRRTIECVATGALASARSQTDACLRSAAELAGATLRAGVNVRRIRRAPDGAVVGFHATTAGSEPLEVSARITVGADGTRSLLARELNAARPIARLHRIALRAYYAGDDAADEAPGVAMHLPADVSKACCGVGPPCGPDRLRNVNIVVPIADSHAMAHRLPEYFEHRLRASFPAVHEALAGSRRFGPIESIGCFGHRTTRAAFPGAVLVGDAAMFIHPFTGEGVYFALRGAQLASDAIDAALRAGSVDARAYNMSRARELGPRYRICDLTQLIVHSPALLSWTEAGLRRSPALTKRVFQVLGDVRRPSSLLRVEFPAKALSAG